MKSLYYQANDYAATSLMFKLSSLFENSVTKVGGTERLKFGRIPQSGDFRGKFSSSPRSPESHL